MANLSFNRWQRRLLKNKSSFVLNLLGLTLGISCFLLTLVFVFYERSYDSANDKRARIFRLATIVHSTSNVSKEAVAGGFLKKFLVERFPEIEKIARFDSYDGRIALHWKPQDALVPVDKIYYADPEAFSIFSYRLSAGDPVTCLNAPNSIVLTQTVAGRLFRHNAVLGKAADKGQAASSGGADALGQAVTLNGKLLKVTGVMQDLPGNSDLRFDALISGVTTRDIDDWAYTYLLFRNSAAAAAFQPKLDTFMKNSIDPQLGLDAGVSLSCILQPLATLHFSPYLEQDTPKGNPVYVDIFLATGLLILFIAFTNSINLTIVQSFSRVMDTTIRKIYGAGKNSLILQHVGESLFIGSLAILLSFLLIWLLLPAFAAVVDRHMSVIDLFNRKVLAAAIGSLLLLGAGGAVYTAVYLKKVRLADSLRSKNIRIRGLRIVPRVMLGVQCCISIGMLIAAISVYRQVDFFRSTPLGFNPTHVLIVDLPQDAKDSTEAARAGETARYLRHTLDCDPDVVMTSLCTSPALPGSPGDLDIMEYRQGNAKVKNTVYHLDVDAQYFNLLQVPVIQGEGFRDHGDSVAAPTALVTTAFMQKAGWRRAIGQLITLGDRTYTVTGVVPDFHFSSLYHGTKPLVIFQDAKAADNLLVRVGTAKTSAVLQRLQTIWKKLYPERPFYYSFLDEHLLQQYRDEYNLLSLLLTLTLLMIAISCIGLVAYVSFLLRMARADIAIRRVIGASFGDIYALYVRQFAALLGIGFAVAAPTAWWLADGWLRQFAYHVSPRVVDPVIAFTAIGVLVGIIVLRYSWTSMRVNPARVLRED